MPGKTTCFPLASYGSHPCSCTGQVAKRAARVLGSLPARGRAPSWAEPPGRLSLSPHIPQHIRNFSCPFPFPCVSFSAAAAALPHHSTPQCERCASSSSAPSRCPCHPWGKAGHWGRASAGAPWLLGKHTHTSPHLSALTDFQDYSYCRPGMLLDFWQLFSRGSCFTPGSNDGICVQYQENVHFL